MCALDPPFRADDMNGLFKRVLKGQYPPIPSHYSMDMRLLIKALLQVKPQSRPNTEQILEMPIVVKRIKKYFRGQESFYVPGLFDNDDENSQQGITDDSELLRTIKLQKNVFKMSLPGSTYGTNGQNINYQTIPGTQVLGDRNNSLKQSKSTAGGLKGNLTNNVSKTTASTLKKNTVTVDESNNVNVSLPTIGSNKKGQGAAGNEADGEYGNDSSLDELALKGSIKRLNKHDRGDARSLG